MVGAAAEIKAIAGRHCDGAKITGGAGAGSRHLAGDGREVEGASDALVDGAQCDVAIGGHEVDGARAAIEGGNGEGPRAGEGEAAVRRVVEREGGAGFSELGDSESVAGSEAEGGCVDLEGASGLAVDRDRWGCKGHGSQAAADAVHPQLDVTAAGEGAAAGQGKGIGREIKGACVNRPAEGEAAPGLNRDGQGAAEGTNGEATPINDRNIVDGIGGIACITVEVGTET